MKTFLDTPNFTLKQVIAAIAIAFAIGGGVVRFEYKTSSIDEKLTKLIAMVDTTRSNNGRKFSLIEQRLLVTENDIKAITTSLTAMLKPEEISIRKKR